LFGNKTTLRNNQRQKYEVTNTHEDKIALS